MCITIDYEKVCEKGPVFRAKNSNNHESMTEYTGLDVEMTVEERYRETLEVIDGVLKHTL